MSKQDVLILLESISRFLSKDILVQWTRLQEVLGFGKKNHML